MVTTQSLSNQKALSWFEVLWRSAKMKLAYERSRAPNPLDALRAFINGQKTSLARLWRLGFHDYVALTRLEVACAQAGLGYPRAKGSDGPPWRLPENFVSLLAEDLPPHPLIDPKRLSSLINEQPDAPPGALAAIHLLLSPESLSSRWVGVPRIYDGLSISGTARVAVCIHLFYPALWPTLRLALEAIPEPWDLYISVPNFACSQTLAKIAEEHPAVRFLPCVNRGRDVLPFLQWQKLGVFDRYDAVCKLHSKRSTHMSDGAEWLTQVLLSLLEDSRIVTGILTRLRTSEVGLIGPQSLRIDASHPAHRGKNHKVLDAIAKRASLPKDKLASPFFAGTMFWFKPAALTGLRGLALHENEFPMEMGQTDGTPAHALERLIWPLVEQAGFSVEVTAGNATSTSPRFITSHPSSPVV